MDEEDAPKRGFGMRGGASSSRSEDGEEDKEGTEPKEELLDDDAEVDVGSEMESVHTDEVLERLDRDLIGLAPVKSRIREIGDLLLVDRLRRRFGIESTRPTLHMSFTGSPGTGKTTVALRMAELLHRLGYLKRGHLVTVTRDDLVGQYIGHTAPKTKEVLKKAMGGVLFVDEAYYLYRQENERDYGQETIEILLQVMENNRDDLVVILAGYKDRMDQFFQSNPGMGSRIAHHIHFPDYDLDELMAIGQLMLDEQQYELSPEAETAFCEYLARRMKQPRFANARSVRNALERARLRQAARIVADSNRKLRKADLMRIEADDILQSRVFDDGDEAAKSARGDARDADEQPDREGEADGAGGDGSEDSAEESTEDSTEDSTGGTAEESNEGTAATSDEDAAEGGAGDSDEDSAQDSDEDPAEDSTEDGAGASAEDEAGDSTEDGAGDGAEDSAEDQVEDDDDAADDDAEDAVEDDAEDAVEDDAEDAAEDDAEDAADDTAEEASDEASDDGPDAGAGAAGDGADGGADASEDASDEMAGSDGGRA